jgi:hypothetical protein
MTSTIEQLRAAIDDGQTADKVAVLDPAAAPLGADEECAGTPIGANEITSARARERALALPVIEARTRDRRRGQMMMWVAVVLVMLFTGLLVFVAR